MIVHHYTCETDFFNDESKIPRERSCVLPLLSSRHLPAINLANRAEKKTKKFKKISLPGWWRKTTNFERWIGDIQRSKRSHPTLC